MTTIQEFLERAQKQLECLTRKQVITWSGTDYVCVPSTFTYEKTVAVGAGPILKEGHVWVRKCLFNDGSGPFPQSQDLVSFRGIQYKLGPVKTDPQDIFLILHLESDSRHA